MFTVAGRPRYPPKVAQPSPHSCPQSNNKGFVCGYGDGTREDSNAKKKYKVIGRSTRNATALAHISKTACDYSTANFE